MVHLASSSVALDLSGMRGRPEVTGAIKKMVKKIKSLWQLRTAVVFLWIQVNDWNVGPIKLAEMTE